MNEKKKRGRPRKSDTVKEEVSQVVGSATPEDVTIGQLSLRIIDFMVKLNDMQQTTSNIVNSLNSFVTDVNKMGHEVAKRVQALEARMSELEQMFDSSKHLVEKTVEQ